MFLRDTVNSQFKCLVLHIPLKMHVHSTVQFPTRYSIITDEGSLLETLDFTILIHIGNSPTYMYMYLYFGLYLNTAYAAVKMFIIYSV